MISPRAWVAENVGVYVQNATAVRDYRVQLRGNRAVFLWAIYLLVLIVFGLFSYENAANRNQMSVVEAQHSLQTFYVSIIALLSTLVALIAPALTATAIVSERQRRSLDLVFSSPMTPKSYLVGKMISSYRYIWMLLVLSLPVTAACVVLGGASWSEVLATYALISIHGLIYTSIALVFSTLAQKPVGAIVWSYIGVGAYAILASLIGESYSATPYFRGHMSNELPFAVALGPYSTFHVVTTYTVIGETHVPNWLLVGIFALLVSKLMLLGAASNLSPFGSKETKSLRIHGLIYIFLISLGFSAGLAQALGLIAPIVASGAPTGSSSVDVPLAFGRLVVSLTLPFMIVLPFLSCYGTDLERKFWPDGLLRIRRILLGTPSGGLPYLWALVFAIALGALTYTYWYPKIWGLSFLAYVFYDLALVFGAWSIGRFTSALNNGLRYARILQFSALLLILVIPPIFLSIISPFDAGGSSTEATIWDLYILRPLFSTADRTALAVIDGFALLVIGILICELSERIAKKRYEKAGMVYERK